VIHAWQFTSADTVLQLGWGVGRPWALGYAVMALVFLAARLGSGRSATCHDRSGQKSQGRCCSAGTDRSQ
jgi:AGZA family xanthine/uracil permease-like MFS transporter